MGKTCYLIKLLSGLYVVDDKIYSGSYKEFGYWIRKYGKMNYVLSKGKAVLTIVKMKKSGRF
jgi:hypothetical protein